MSHGNRGEPRPVAAHLVGTFYAVSENWIATAIQHLTRYRPLVLANRLRNLETLAPAPECVALYGGGRVDAAWQWLARRVIGHPPRFRRALSDAGARLLHAHFGWTGHAGLGLAAVSGARLVTSFYGHDLSALPRTSRRWRARYARLFAEGDAFLVEGEHMAEKLRRLGCPADKVRVHRLGIDLARFSPARRRPQPGDEYRALVVGRLCEKKGQVFAVRAFAAHLAGGGRGRLTIVGAADGSEASLATERAIHDAIRDSGVGAQIDLLGALPVDRLRELYASHDVVLAPSVEAADGDAEGGAPVVVIEAAAAGLPVIASRHCDIPGIVRDGDTGLLVAERDVDGLAAALRRLDADRDLGHRLGAAGRAHVEREHDARTQGARLEKIYDALLLSSS